VSVRAAAPNPLRELLASLGALTVVPVAVMPTRRWSVLGFAPVVGLLLGGVAAGVVVGGHLLFPGIAGALLTAALTIGTLALLTRGLHLDGLADTADGLGKRGPAEASLAVMRRADIGPFGIATVVIVLLADVSALGRDVAAGRGALAVLVAVTCGRLALLQAGVAGIPAARTDGLGAWVAESVPRAAAWSITGSVLLASLIPAALGDLTSSARAVAAVTVGCAAATALRRRSVRRFRGITGDVLGATAEVATCAALVVTAVR
jgi:adenosylcobinamide-GDP ribazoletransferase